MIICPACGYDRNIEGADLCERCQSPLAELSQPRPQSPLEQSIFQERIYALKPRKPVTVAPTATVSEVLQLLLKNNAGCVLVVQGDNAVGIFTERDALWRINDQADVLGDRPIADYMTPAPQTLEATDKIAFALRHMDQGGYHHLVVRAEGRIVGIVTAPDLMKFITERLVATS